MHRTSSLPRSSHPRQRPHILYIQHHTKHTHQRQQTRHRPRGIIRIAPPGVLAWRAARVVHGRRAGGFGGEEQEDEEQAPAECEEDVEEEETAQRARVCAGCLLAQLQSATFIVRK